MNDPSDPIRFDPNVFDLDSLDVETATDDASEEDDELTREELAWELVELLDELSVEEMGELVAKNVPLESLDFFSRYAEEFSEGLPIDAATSKRLPNLMLLGYLLRVLEDRLLVDPGSFDA